MRELYRYCGWCFRGELGGESVFILLVDVWHVVIKVRVRFGIVVQLLAWKTLHMDGMEEVWFASVALPWVSLGTVCVEGCRGVFWLGILVRFARDGGGGVVMPLFCVCFCGVFYRCVAGGEV